MLIHYVRRGKAVEDPKLIITPKKYAGESAVISLRLYKDMIRDIDAAAAASGRTRNELMTTCLEFALNHLEVIAEDKKEKR